MNANQIRKAILKAGVKNLESFGYEGSVNVDNIMTDFVYRSFFKRMLEENLATPNIDPKVAGTLSQLIKEIEVTK